jgi:hypothetical protein
MLFSSSDVDDVFQIRLRSNGPGIYIIALSHDATFWFRSQAVRLQQGCKGGQKLGSREDLNLFSAYASFRDSGLDPINTSDSSCPRNLLDDDFCTGTKFFCHQLSSVKSM